MDTMVSGRYTGPDMSCDHPPELRWLAERLAAAGYSADALCRRFGIRFPDDIGLLNHAPSVERLLGDRSPAATLMRLFFLEAQDERHAVDAALEAGACARMTAIGLLRQRDNYVSSRLRIEAVGSQYFLADRRFHRLDPAALRLGGRDPVYPPSSDSLLLRQVLALDGRRSVLDLCTGSGVQALALAGQAERLVCVDLNPRAAAMARLNARLNGVEVDVRIGDLYAPLRGEQFDVIIANPPFVSSPYDRGPAYHAGGASGDRILRRVIGGWARYLAGDGRAFAIAHAGLRRGQTLETMARRWFAGFPGRALVLVLESGGPIDLAAAQAQFALARGTRAYAAEVRRWVEYLDRHRIESIVAFLVVAQRGHRQSVEVVDGTPRILPLPLSKAPPERVVDWLAGG